MLPTTGQCADCPRFVPVLEQIRFAVAAVRDRLNGHHEHGCSVVGAGNHQAGLVGEDDGLHSVPDMEFVQYATDVGLDRLGADDEPGGHFHVGEAFGDEAENLGLPWG